MSKRLDFVAYFRDLTISIFNYNYENSAVRDFTTNPKSQDMSCS